MSPSNLDLLTIQPDKTHALRYVNVMFPGALPFELFFCGNLVGRFISLDEALRAAKVERWSSGIDTDGVMFGASLDGQWTVQQGENDWPVEERQKRVILVGELNPYQDRKEFDLYDLPERASGHRLRELVLGVSREDYYRRFYRRNLCVGKWSLSATKKRAFELCEEFPKHTLVLLGRKVQEAFGFFTYPLPFECLWSPKSDTMLWPDRFIVRLPHPSGLCREWSDPTAFVWARDALRTAGVFCKSE